VSVHSSDERRAQHFQLVLQVVINAAS